ncbi:MAG: GHKL domain-containing protein [Desulfobulbaceae bacterium]|nr:GHKL domain-containing protein [Desulfobulbaceae bacterium]
MHQEHHKKLGQLLTAAFFVCGVMPIGLMALVSLPSSRQIALLALAAVGICAASFWLSRFFVARFTATDQDAIKLDEQMAHVEKMASIGSLAAGITHDINNPLQMILSHVGWMHELLGDEDPAQVKNLEEYKNACIGIRHHVNRASKITHRLLGFARKTDGEQTSVQVNELVEETRSFLEKKALYNNIEFVLQLEPGLPATMTEGNRLQQVVLNLMDNALDAVAQDGKVCISTSRDDRQIRIDIIDSGPGIPAQMLTTIWNPFFTTKKKGEGTGLGLAISRSIVQSLGGALTAQNRSDGTGAIFTVKIPINTVAITSTIETGQENGTI